jgi:hypothetical protein
MAGTLYLVTGMHRSGTSLVARMLQVYGITLPGVLVGPAEDNEKGFFEDSAIVAFNDRLIERLGLRWDSLHGFFLTKSDFASPKFNHLKKEARELVQARAESGQDWAFKDPRVSRLMGFWLPLLETINLSVKVVVVLRDPSEVAGSLAQRNRFPHLKSLYLWLFYNLDLMAATVNLPRVLVRYEALMDDPGQTVDALSDFMGTIDPEEKKQFVQTFLSRALHHNQDVELNARVKLADELLEILKSGFPDVSRLQALVAGATDNPEALALLRTFSEQELAHETEMREQHDELAGLVGRRDREVDEFREYQAELQDQLASKEAWNEKLSRDLESLGSDVALLQDVKFKQDRRIEELQVEQQQHEDQRKALEEQAHQESIRLWAIVEKYRLQLEQMEQSHSWRVTAPLRWLRRIPGWIWRHGKTAVKKSVFNLPPDSMVRQYLVKLYERGQLLVHGDVDNHSIRESHRRVIADRDQEISAG